MHSPGPLCFTWPERRDTVWVPYLKIFPKLEPLTYNYEKRARNKFQRPQSFKTL